MKTSPKSVDEYIDTFPAETRAILEKMRYIIINNALNAVESISYGMPAYKLNGKPLVYFAGYKNHIGFYATPTGHTAFTDALSKYKQGKGSVQFPIAETIPYELVEKIVRFRVIENQQ